MDILNGFMDALQFANLIFVFIGVILGIFVGAIPGLSGPIAIAMLIPLTYYMPTVGAIGFLVGINKGGCFGGSISSILLNTPGSPEATATTFDGYPMTLKGKGLKAMKVALISSVFGDFFSTALVILVAASIASVALRMGPPELTSILLLALLLIAILESESLLNGVVAACFGLLLSSIGLEPVAAQPRLTMGFYQLEAGIPIATIGIGMLAIAELSRQIITAKSVNASKKQEEQLKKDEEEIRAHKEANKLKAVEVARLGATWLRSSLIGSFIGALPGIGSTVACFLSYGIAKKLAKPGEKFGEGEIKGVAAPETSNNAVVGASLIPLFTLGIPGSVATSLLVGAFIVHGITPGPLMFEEHGRAVYGIYGSMIISCVAVLFIGYGAIHIGEKVLSIPKQILYPIIMFTCLIGAYILQQEEFDVFLMLFFGVAGLFMRVVRFSFVAFIIGFVLGKSFEVSFQQTFIAGNGNLLVLFERPISCGIMIITCIFLGYIIFSQIKGRKRAKALRRAGNATGSSST